jgi:thiol-disulfide isomerase/thioredoxin
VSVTPAFLLIDRDGERVTPQPIGFDEVRTWLTRQEAADSEALARALPVVSRGEALEREKCRADGQVTVLQFFSPTCGACRSAAPALRELVEEQRDVAFSRVDVSQGGPIVAQYRIRSTPTYLVFAADGRLVGRADSSNLRRLAGLVQKAKNGGRR